MNFWQGALTWFYVVPAIAITLVAWPDLGFRSALFGGLAWPVILGKKLWHAWTPRGRHRR